MYEANEPALSRPVAVKLFRARVGGDDRRSFEREATAMGRLSGIRNVVQVYRSGVTEDDHPYLVIELMDGSLADLLEQGPVPARDVCRAGVLLGRALHAAHAEGILHRDIKPANILIDRYGEPALSDFGIASLADSGGNSFIYAFTAEHAAPEVFDRPDPSPAADVYSLASTIYTAMEGHAPFARDESEGALAFMRRVQETPCPSAPRPRRSTRTRRAPAGRDGEGPVSGPLSTTWSPVSRRSPVTRRRDPAVNHSVRPDHTRRARTRAHRPATRGRFLECERGRRQRHGRPRHGRQLVRSAAARHRRTGRRAHAPRANRGPPHARARRSPPSPSSCSAVGASDRVDQPRRR